MEAFGDMWGREVRYGGGPIDPDEPLERTIDENFRPFVDSTRDMSRFLSERSAS
jgi:hypothetical protein